MMPSGVMDQRRFPSLGLSSASSPLFQEEIRLSTQRQVGFWKADAMPEHHEADGFSVSSSPLESRKRDDSLESLDLSHLGVLKEKNLKRNLLRQPVGAERTARTSTSLTAAEGNFRPQNNIHIEQSLTFRDDKKFDTRGMHQETSLFSSSLSEIFDSKMRMSSNGTFFDKSLGIFRSNFIEDEPLKSLEEIEAHTIGNLLPDDDDFLAGITEDIDHVLSLTNADDIEDDLFRSIGGLELDTDDNLNCDLKHDFAVENDGQRGVWCGPYGTEHPFGEQPSRTLFVRNINSNVDDAELKSLFEKYGDIRMLYTACKHRGFVMISYHDIRAALNAMNALQQKPLNRRKLDIHFSIPKENSSEEDVNQGILVLSNVDSSLSNDDLHRIFCAYGEIKEIRESPRKLRHKFIEFFDARAAEDALRALKKGEITGCGSILEPGFHFDARCSTQLSSIGSKMEDLTKLTQSPSNNSTLGGTNGTKFEAIPHFGRDNGATRGFPSSVAYPYSMFSDAAFPEVPNSLPRGTPQQVRPVNNCSDPDEASHPLGNPNFGFQNMLPHHPRSLPEYHNGVIAGFPSSSSTTASTMAQNLDSRATDGYCDGQLPRVTSSFNSQTKGAFGFSGMGSSIFNGQQFAWGNSNLDHNRTSHMIWPSSQSFVNGGISSHSPALMPSLARPSPHMLNTILPLHSHHVGSAPPINSSLWERRNTYTANPMDVPAFHPGSLGSMGFSGNFPLHPLDMVSHNMLPHAGGSCMDPSISSLPVGLPSPQQRCHMLHGRNPMVPVPVSSYDAPGDRFRSRRNESALNQADAKRQYELDIDRIVRFEDSRTTLMVKNIPNKYTSKMLLAAIDEHHRGTYDFIYLPIDFKNKCNVGYAFINMIDSQHIIPFYQTFNGKKWEKFNSEKVASLAYARIQGKAALIAHFQNSSLMNEDKRCRPILFHSDGPNAGDQEPFPLGVNTRSRSGRTRSASNEENGQGSPPNSPKRGTGSFGVPDPPTHPSKESLG